MSTPVTTRQCFKHRILVEEANDLGISAEKIGQTAYRAKSIMSVLLNLFLDQSDYDEGQIISMLEVAIEEVKDIQEIARLIEFSSRNPGDIAKPPTIEQKAKSRSIAGGAQ